MKFSLVFLLPATLAFSPSHLPGRTAIRQPSTLVTRNELDDVCEKVTSTTEEYVGKADSLILSRAMRVVDHAPMLCTLKALTDKAGISASIKGITSDPAAFGGISTALAVPTWCFNVWTLIAVAQVASAARSILVADGNELSQADITANTAANFVAARTIGSSSPLKDTILTALVSGYALRVGSSSGSVDIHKAGMQLMSSFTTVLAVLGVVEAVASHIPILSGQAQIIRLFGVLSYYGVATRDGNGTVKKAVTGGVAAGMLYAAVSGGISISASITSVLSNVGTIGLAYVAYQAVNRARKAIF